MIEVKGLTKSFGGLLAVNHLDLTAREGKISGLIGPNGAGKSTVFNLITGYIKPDEGSISCGGVDITGLRPHVIAREYGIARTFQTAPLFPTLTAMQSAIIAVQMSSSTNYSKLLLSSKFFTKREIERAEEVLQFWGLAAMRSTRTVDLPHGDLQRLRLGLAMATQPRILLLDEPFSGMSAEEIERMGMLILKLKEQGKTILMVEHNIAAVMSLCDELTCMSFGEKIFEGSPRAAKEDKKVIECYLGAEYVGGK